MLGCPPFAPSAGQKLIYVRENPLRKDPVKNSDDWPFQERVRDIQWTAIEGEGTRGTEIRDAVECVPTGEGRLNSGGSLRESVRMQRGPAALVAG